MYPSDVAPSKNPVERTLAMGGGAYSISATVFLRMKEARILQKASLLQAVRQYFSKLEFIEVDTPILQTSLVPELHVHSFHLPCVAVKKAYLLPSPELGMKRLLCDWNEQGQPHSIYQLAHCFRWEEEQDALHSQEFLMLELYAMQYSSRELLQLIADLLRKLSSVLPSPFRNLLQQEPRVLSFDDLCQLSLGVDFTQYWGKGLLGLQQLYLLAKGSAAPKSLGVDDLFHLILVEFLEPYIRQHIDYCVLYPYPDATPLPAKQFKQPSEGPEAGAWSDRWELYLAGVELANACKEENEGEELGKYRTRFIAELNRASRIAEAASFNMEIFRLWQKLPDCSGAALGIDRLLMITNSAV